MKNSNIADVIVNRALATGVQFGKEWPNDAVFLVVTRASTWPMGWSESLSLEWVKTTDEVDAIIARMADWGLCEDNYYAVQVWEWDLGPTHRPEYDHNADRIPAPGAAHHGMTIIA